MVAEVEVLAVEEEEGEEAMEVDGEGVEGVDMAEEEVAAAGERRLHFWFVFIKCIIIQINSIMYVHHALSIRDLILLLKTYTNTTNIFRF